MNDFFMTDEEARVLAWIHSNKFITTKLFQKKFKKGKSFVAAFNALEILAKAKGFLKPIKTSRNSDSFFFCTRGTLSKLKDAGLILTSPSVRAPKMNTFEKEHDKRIIEFRIQVEQSEGLDDLVWLSDYEMRIGYKLEWKEILKNQDGNKIQNVRLFPARNTVKIPDGQFTATVDGEHWKFVLEYEHMQYPASTLNGKVHELWSTYTGAIKLIVVKDESRIKFWLKSLQDKFIDPEEKASWWFTHYKATVGRPFLEIPWIDLEEYHPRLLRLKGKNGEKFTKVNKPRETQEKLNLQEEDEE